MATLILGSYMFRYPLGGNISWVLQWLVGLKRLNHDVIFVEKGNYPYACFDPERGTSSNDPQTGISIVNELLRRHALNDKWCYVDYNGKYYGLDEITINRYFKEADLFIDMGTHGSWLDKAAETKRRVLVELEPGYTQMKIMLGDQQNSFGSLYDAYYTNGLNIGTKSYCGPTAGIDWKHVINPVCLDLFTIIPPPAASPVTTVMNWQAHDPINFEGVTYGQKDVEFQRFMALPLHLDLPFEVAVAGPNVPSGELIANGWSVIPAHQATRSLHSYLSYISGSLAEFSVCKQVFQATCSGWFSDRSAAYLASGRPVVVQDTGFSRHLPCGQGLFAVNDVEEAVAALTAIAADYSHHSEQARALAETHLDARRILSSFLLENEIS